MKEKKRFITVIVVIALAAATGVGGYTFYKNRKPSEETVQADVPEKPEMETEEEIPQILEGGEQKKEETVYVKAAADGTAKDIIVSDILRNGTESMSITDRSDLKKIRNVKGKETYQEGADQELIWQTDGKDIYYQGESDKTLPVELKITYYLEGEEISPKKLAGKSGNVKIRFDYVNHETQTVTVDGEERIISTPFVVLTGAILDEEKFMNVEMENGRVISDGSRIMAGGAAFPGLSDSIALSEVEDMDDLDLPEYLELTAYTTCFELPMTMTVITSDFSEEIDLDDLDSYDDLKDDMQELKDASEELVDGTNELLDGVIELKDGADELYDGAKELKDGSVELDDGAGDLQDGALELKDALKAYNEGINTLAASMANADGNGTDIAAVAQSVKAGVDRVVNMSLESVLLQVNAALTASSSPTIPDVNTMLQAYQAGQLPDSASETITELLTLQQGMAALSAGISQIYSATTTQLQPASGQILDGARKLYAGTKDLKEGTEELLDGTNELLDGTVELKDGVQEIYDGSVELRDGMEEFDEDGIQKLYDMVCGDMQKVIDRARTVVDAGKAYQSYTQIAPGMKGTVKFLIETESVE